MHVKCCCNGENCKINIAGVFLALCQEYAHLLTAFAVDVFALQLLSIVVYISENGKHGCMVMLFML